MLPAPNANFPLMLSRRDGESAEQPSFSLSAGPGVGGQGPHGDCQGGPGCGHGHGVHAAEAAEHPERVWLDRVGIVLSAVCAVHCALTPILVAVAPFFFTAEFEFRTKAVLLSLAVIALGWGFVSHRSWRPLIWLGGALVAFGVGEWIGHGGSSHGEWFEVAATVAASGALIMAHVTNARACRVSAPHGHVALFRW